MATDAPAEQATPATPGEPRTRRRLIGLLAAIAAILIALTIWTAVRTASAAPFVILGALLVIGALVLWAAARASRRWGSAPRMVGWALVALSALYLAWFATNPFGAALPGGIMLPGTLSYGGRTYEVQRIDHGVWHEAVRGLHGDVCFFFRGFGTAPPVTAVHLVGSVRVPFATRLQVGISDGDLLWVYVPTAHCAVSYLAKPPRHANAAPGNAIDPVAVSGVDLPPLRLGSEMAVMMLDLHNVSSQAISIEGVSVPGNDGAVLRLVEVRSAPLPPDTSGREWVPGGIYRFYPPALFLQGHCHVQRLAAATVYVLQPGHETRLLFVWKAVATGRFHFPGTVVTYSTTAGTVESQYLPLALKGTVTRSASMVAVVPGELACADRTMPLPTGK